MEREYYHSLPSLILSHSHPPPLSHFLLLCIAAASLSSLAFHFGRPCPLFEASVLLLYSSLDESLYDSSTQQYVSHSTQLKTVSDKRVQNMRTWLSCQQVKLNPVFCLRLFGQRIDCSLSVHLSVCPSIYLWHVVLTDRSNSFKFMSGCLFASHIEIL